MAMLIKAAEKRDAINALVMDTVRDRVIALRQEVDEHYLAIMNEVLDEDSVQEKNSITQTLYDQREAIDHMINITIAIGDVYADVDFLTEKELRVREITTIKSHDADPLNVAPYSMAGKMSDAVRDVFYQARPEPVVTLPLPLLVLTTTQPPRDTKKACAIVNPALYDDNVEEFDIDQVDVGLPTECSTRRDFRNRYEAVAKDANNLYEQLVSLTKNCRSVESLTKAVPQLGEYVNEPEAELVPDVGSLLKKARG